MMSDMKYLNAALAECEHVVGGRTVRVEYAHDFGDWTVVDLPGLTVPVTGCRSPLEAFMAAEYLGRGKVEAYIATLLSERWQGASAGARPPTP